MLQPDVVSRLRLMAENARVPELATHDRVQQVGALRPGERIHARVDRELPIGRFLVTVRGQAFEMTLPPGTRPGDTLRLTFLDDNPRPTFFLLNARSGEESDRLSQTGRLISALMRRGDGDAQAPARAAPPLLPDGPADAGQSAPRLREALAHSGLFYESHQAQWVAGMRSLEQLRREPQANVNAAPAGGADLDIAAPARPGEDAPRAADLRGGPVHPETFPIVRQQLEALETRHAAWQGEIWHDQWMEWETGEDPEGRGPDGQPAWFTSLLLQMPSLGSLRVRAVLAAEGVRVTLSCADEAAAQRLRDGAELGGAGLGARGLALAALSVKPAAEPGNG
jgi:hypothetical protein